MSVKIGSITADFIAKTQGFTEGMEKIQSSVKKTNAAVKAQTDQMKANFEGINKAMGSLGVGLSAGAVIGVMKGISDQFSKIKDGASAANMSIEQFQTLDYVARNNGASVESFTAALNKLDSKLSEAVGGNADAIAFFDKIGVSVGKMEQMSGGERIAALAQYIKGSSNEASAFADVAAVLGEKNLPKLREALIQLADGWDVNTQAAKNANQIIGEETVKAWDDARDAMSNFGKGAVVATSGYFSDMARLLYITKDGMAGAGVSVNDMQSSLDFLVNSGYAKVIPYYKDIAEKLKLEIIEQKKLEEQRKATADAIGAKKAVETDNRLATISKAQQDFAEINKSTDDAFVKMDKLSALYKTLWDAPKGSEKVKADTAAAMEALDSQLTKRGQELEKSIQTPAEKFRELSTEIDKLAEKQYIKPENVAAIKNSLDPAIKAATESTKEYNDLLASVDANQAFKQQIQAINDKMRKLGKDTSISTAELNKLGDALKKQAKENTPDFKAAKEIKDRYMTPSQKKKEEATKINANTNLDDATKKQAIKDIGIFEEKQRMIQENSVGIGTQNSALWKAAGAEMAAYNEQIKNASSGEELAKIRAQVEQTRDTFQFMGDVGKEAIGSISAGFAQIVTEGGNVKDMLKNVLKMIMQMIIQKAMAKSMSGLFGGFFAGGGDVGPGKTYIVGEKGPELFTTNARGTIIPNNKLAGGAGGSSPVINFNLSAYDTTSMDQMIAKRTPAIINAAMNRLSYERSRGNF